MNPFRPKQGNRGPRWMAMLTRALTVALLLTAAVTVRTQGAGSPLMAEGPGGLSALGIPGEVDDDGGEYHLAQLPILNRAIRHVKNQYVDPKRVVPRDMVLAGLDALEKQVAEVVVDESGAPNAVTVTVGRQAQTFDISNVDSLWRLGFVMRNVFRFVEPLLAKEVDKHEAEYATINGMLSTLDPHSVLLPPSTFEEMKMTTSGEFGGLGIVIGLRDGALTIISPMDGTPASQAGLQAKDQIAKINDESTVNMALDEAVKRLRGKAGTAVTIYVMRKGWSEPRRFDITRAVIKIINVTHSLMAGGVGYVKVKNFQADTASDVQNAVKRMRSQAGGQLSGMVLDLRNNPGGLLEQAVDLSDLFLDRGVIVTTVGVGDSMREEKSARWAGTERDLPLVVLVNGGSASASEIVAGALKNNGRALVAGATTFGKGSVQTLLNFMDQSALKLTIAQYLTPGDVSIQSIGITPDVDLVPMVVDAKTGDVDLAPDVHHTREKDLDKHLDDRRAVGGGKPELVLRHMEEKPDQDAEEARDLSNKFKEDFEIGFARQVVLNAGTHSNNRASLLAAARKVAANLGALEEQKVFDALKPLAVDWTPPPVLGGGANTARLSARVVGQPVAQAGQTLSIPVEVANEGPETVYRLRANTESDNRLFVDREFLFGKLAPGEKHTWTLNVKLPKDAISRADDVTLTFSEGKGRVPAPLTVRTQITELPRPTFRYTAWLDDSAGNGDGRVDLGEKVDLVVSVTNDGPGVAEEPLLLLKNLGGRETFITAGRAKLEPLAPKQTQVARLSFEPQPDAKRMLEMRLTILDASLGEYAVQKLTYRVSDEHPPVKAVHQTGTVTQSQALVAWAGAKAPEVGQVKKGTRLTVDRLVGEHARVDLGDGQHAFVRVSGLKLGSARKAAKGLPQGVKLGAGTRAPTLTISTPEAGLTTAADAVTLSADAAHATGVRDAIVFVNDQKVLFKAFEKGADQAAPHHLQATLPLKKGTNTVSVVVRVDSDVAARRVLIIHREQEPATAAALELSGGTTKR